MERIRWERLAAILICIAFGGALLILGLRYLLPILLPFLVAWLFSLLIRPLSAKLAARIPLPQKLWAGVLLVAFLGGLALLLGFSVIRLIRELGRLVECLLESNGGVEGAIHRSLDYLETLASNVSWLRPSELGENHSAFRAQLSDMISQMLGSMLSAISAELPQLAGRIISALPSILLVTLITVIAGFYFCVDGDRIGNALCDLLPTSVRQKLPVWRQRSKQVSWRYVRAYLLLLTLTFGELFLGLSILRVEYAFLLSLIIAVVDVLPVLGVGTVLVPWAVVALLQKNFYLGFGLLILYAASTVLRQILEPKLVGNSLGLHPLLTLFAGYAGWRLFGILGMVLGPVFALLCKTVVTQICRLTQREGT